MNGNSAEMLVFVQGVLGGVMLGWGLILTLITLIPLHRGENWAWWTLAGAILFIIPLIMTKDVLWKDRKKK